MSRHAILVIVLLASTAIMLPARGQPLGEYVGSAVDLRITPEKLNDFLAAARENASSTVKEPGNVAYAISQSSDDPNSVFLFEVYKDAQAIQVHRNSDHFKKYMEATKDMVMSRQSRPIRSVSLFTHSR